MDYGVGVVGEVPDEPGTIKPIGYYYLCNEGRALYGLGVAESADTFDEIEESPADIISEAAILTLLDQLENKIIENGLS